MSVVIFGIGSHDKVVYEKEWLAKRCECHANEEWLRGIFSKKKPF